MTPPERAARGGAKRVDDEPNTPSAEPAAGIRPASLGIGGSHATVAFGASAVNVLGKVREGIDVEELTSYLDVDRDGRVHIEDLHTFMLKSWVAPESEVGNATHTDDDRKYENQLEIEAFPRATREEFLHAKTSSVATTNKRVPLVREENKSHYEAPTLLLLDPTLLNEFQQWITTKTKKESNAEAKGSPVYDDEMGAKHNVTITDGTADRHLEPPQTNVSGVSITPKTKQNPQTAMDRFEQRLQMKLEQERNSAAVANRDTTYNVVGTNAKMNYQSRAILSGRTIAPNPKEQTLLSTLDQRIQMKTEQEDNHVAKNRIVAHDIADANARIDHLDRAQESAGSTALKPKTQTTKDIFKKRIQMKIEQQGDSAVAGSTIAIHNIAGTDATSFEPSKDTLLGGRIAPRSNAQETLNKFEERIIMKLEQEGNDDRISASDDDIVDNNITIHDTAVTNASMNHPHLASGSDAPKPTAESAVDKFEQLLQMKMEQQGGSADDSITAHNFAGTNAKMKYLDQAKVPDGTIASKPNAKSAMDKFEQRMQMKLEQEGKISIIDNSDNVHNAGVNARTNFPDQTEARQLTNAVDIEPSGLIVDDRTTNFFNESADEELGPSNGVDTNDDIFLTATSEWTPQARSSNSGNDEAVGMQGDGQQLVRRRRQIHEVVGQGSDTINGETRRRRQEADTDSGESQGTENEQDSGNMNLPASSRRTGRTSTFIRGTRIGTQLSIFFAQHDLITATLVDEVEGDVVVAERVGYFEQRWKCLVCSTSLLLVLILAVSLSVVLIKEEKEIMFPSDIPSMQPSSSPSFDPAPTLEIVQTRGHLRIGLDNNTIISKEGFRLDVGRAIAAVILGSPESVVGVPVTGATRFRMLNGRDIDLLLNGDTHTIEREVKEKTTGAGFTFSSPYYYDGTAYFGNETFVRCAEEQLRFDECSLLKICVQKGTTGHVHVQSSFPSYFVEVVPSFGVQKEMLWSGKCNAIASVRSFLLTVASSVENRDTNFIVGDQLFTKEPLSIVSRDNDHEFSDIINWVVQALFYGEEQGLTKNSSLCQKYTHLSSPLVSDLNFFNAIYCVGNYGEIYNREYDDRGMNQINNGTTGMLYATPFGGQKIEDLPTPTNDVFLNVIKAKGSLNCGIVVPGGFDGEISESHNLAGMNVDYCRALAAALFNGNSNVAKLSIFAENDDSSFAALDNGTIDVLAGRRIEKQYSFGSPLSVEGFRFSTPYYYGNESAGDDVSFFSFATRADDVMFSSLVNCVVLATIYAQEKKITKEDSKEMPLLSVFGSEFRWVLRDVIAYMGSYDQIYTKNFGNILEEDRGRNTWNNKGGPQIHSFPGLSSI